MIEIAALIVAIVGPLITGIVVYLAARAKGREETAAASRTLRDEAANDISHLNARLTEIEVRLGRLEVWILEHQRNHGGRAEV